MRVLIITALFACASAAPSGLLAPVAVAGVPAVAAIPAVHAIAPVNAGDLQGALIDAKVKTEDYLRSVAEQQRESVRVAAIPVQAAPVAAFPVTNLGDLNGALIDAKVRTEDFLRSVADQQRDAVEQAVVDTNEKVIEANDQVQEKAVETFWADQEKKWQEYDAVQTAQAQLEGKIASESEAVAKSVVVPAVAPVVPAVAPVVPYSPYVVPGVIAPVAKTTIEIPEAPKPEEKKAEEPKAEEKPEEPKSDSVQVESAAVKTAEAEKVPETKYVVGQTPLLATFPLSPLKFAPQPWAPVVAPGIQTIVPYGAHVIAPTVLKTVW